MHYNNLVLHCSKWMAGNGTKVRFWEDLWCGSTVLKNSYPLIFAISKDKDITIKKASESGRFRNIEVKKKSAGLGDGGI